MALARAGYVKEDLVVAERTKYEILDVDPSASSDEVRAAYRSMIGDVRPDGGASAASLPEVQDAYATLSHPDRRENYDLSLTVLRLTPQPQAVPELPREAWSPRMGWLQDRPRSTTRPATHGTGGLRVGPVAWLALLVGAAVVVAGAAYVVTNRHAGTTPSTTAAPPTTGSPGATTPGTAAPGAATAGGVPAVPFTIALSGQQTQTRPDAHGNVQITFAMELQDAAHTPLRFAMNGKTSGPGGFNLSSGVVTYGQYHGTVVGLYGTTVTMHVDAPGPTTLVADLTVDSRTRAISGTVKGTAGTP